MTGDYECILTTWFRPNACIRDGWGQRSEIYNIKSFQTMASAAIRNRRGLVSTSLEKQFTPRGGSMAFFFVSHKCLYFPDLRNYLPFDQPNYPFLPPPLPPVPVPTYSEFQLCVWWWWEIRKEKDKRLGSIPSPPFLTSSFRTSETVRLGLCFLNRDL